MISVNPNTIYPLLRQLEARGDDQGRLGAPRSPDPELLLDHAAGRREHQRLRDEVEPFLDSVIRSVGLIKRELYGP